MGSRYAARECSIGGLTQTLLSTLPRPWRHELWQWRHELCYKIQINWQAGPHYCLHWRQIPPIEGSDCPLSHYLLMLRRAREKPGFFLPEKHDQRTLHPNPTQSSSRHPNSPQNEWCIYTVYCVLCIAVHPNRFTIMLGGNSGAFHVRGELRASMRSPQLPAASPRTARAASGSALKDRCGPWLATAPPSTRSTNVTRRSSVERCQQCAHALELERANLAWTILKHSAREYPFWTVNTHIPCLYILLENELISPCYLS